MRAALLSLLALVTTTAAAAPVFVLVDRKGDDYGAGDLIYPNREDLQRGDLDLVSFSAEPTQGGTLFRVEFARSVRDPRGVVTQVGQLPMERLARNGFYTFSVDVYIDTDRVAGSGRTHSIPGRRVTIDRQYAWEKVVVLTPRPEVAASVLENQLLVEAEADLRAREGRASRYRLEFIAGELKKEIDSLYFFPNRVRVTGRAVEFFVPDSVLPGPASRSWAYTVVVTGADLEQAGPPLSGSRRRAPMMTMGVALGITYDSFGIRSDVDPGVPPVVDLLAAGPGVQEAALNSYDVVAPRLAAVPGVAPDGRPATTPAGEELTAEETQRIESVARGSAPPASPSTASGAAAAGQPSGASAPRTVAQRLRELNQLLEDGLITPEEHAELRRKILAEL